MVMRDKWIKLPIVKIIRVLFIFMFLWSMEYGHIKVDKLNQEGSVDERYS